MKQKPFAWPKPRPKASLDNLKDRWPWSKRMFIDHPDIKVVTEDAWEAIARVKRKDKSIAMLILGESGAGKTTFANEFVLQTQQIYSREDPAQTIVPAILLEVPENCTDREFCLSILRKLGDPKPESRKSPLTGVVVDLLRKCETRVIVIDNVQDIPTRRRSRGVEQVSVRLRELIDQSRCLWLLLGTSRARDVVNSESQLIKRVAYRKTLKYFAIDSEQNAKRFVQMLYRIDEWLPLVQSNRVLLAKMAGKIFIATHGVLQRVEELLDLACEIALKDSREQLSEDDLLKGFENLYGHDVPNPFASDFVLRKLTGVDEPFEKLAASPPPEDLKKTRRGDGRRAA